MAFTSKDVALSMNSCAENFVSEIIDSVEFSTGEMSPEENEKLSKKLYSAIEKMAKDFESQVAEKV
ncbi:hypothetical protein [Thalassotalea marina]|uniref:Uncharacterized protein n=1 Tax=Thalassotalea marina TaxID=1673741 RepID=A0A919EQF1_9GAMM|nr:hypothetical protein [Thalassotalea marina]GHG07794.1 hypothetical protein GCM10017161_41920 [Thalassotalea marina]